MEPATLSLLTSIGGGGLSFFDSWYTNRQNQKNAREQREWEKYMYQNRYQMQVQDLKAAGLNPMLAYTQSPGGAPTGATAVAQKSDMARVMNESRIASAQEGNIRADTQKKLTESANIEMDTLVKAGMPEVLASQVRQATASAEQSRAMIKQIEVAIPKVVKEIEQIEQKIKLDKSNVLLNNSLIEMNGVLNGLRVAETYLTGARTRTEGYNADILYPKSRAAESNAAYGGYMMEHIGKYGTAAWKFLFPTLGGK